MATENKKLYNAFMHVLWMFLNIPLCYIYATLAWSGFGRYCLFILAVAVLNVIVSAQIKKYFYG